MKPPDPVVYPPPCSQTITGRFVFPLLLALGVQTLSTRQSSPIGSAGHIGSSAFGTKPKKSESRCGERCPRSKQSFTPVHFSRFAGGIKRFAPAVEAAYGTPRNACTPACVCERPLPRFVSTVAPGVGPSAPPSAIASLLFIKVPAANAPMLEPINLRRSMTLPPKVGVHPVRRTDAATAARTDPSVPFSLRPRTKFRRAFLALPSSSIRRHASKTSYYRAAHGHCAQTRALGLRGRESRVRRYTFQVGASSPDIRARGCSLIPAWMRTQLFLAYFTGAGFITAGVSFEGGKCVGLAICSPSCSSSE